MQNDFKIDKGIELPPRGTRPSRYPWLEMEVGDSFVVQPWEGCSRLQPYISSIACSAGKKLGRKFTTRKEGDNVRVWRTA